MNASPTIAKLAAALVAAQKDIKAIAKDSTNPHYKNKYASLDSIIASVRPILATHKLAIVQGATNPIVDSDGALAGFTVETLLLHESGEFITADSIMPLTKVDAQGAGGALTYGRRYGISALLALSTDEDDDGAVASERVQRTTVSRPAPAVGSSIDERAPLDEDQGAQAEDEPSCPKCGGKVWDNRLTKKNPKAPDFKCRNRSCDGVIWPPRPAEKAAVPPGRSTEQILHDDDRELDPLPF